MTPILILLAIQSKTSSNPISATTAIGLPKETTDRIFATERAAAKAVREARPLLDAGRNAEAERMLATVLARYPRLVPARTLYAEALIRQGKDAEALGVLLDLRDRQRVWSEGSAARIALLRARLGQTGASRADWRPEIVMRYCEGLPEARASLPSVATPKGLETAWSLAAGYLSDLHGDTPGAAFYYGRALALDPANAFANLKMGDLELRTGKAASAVGRYALAARGAGSLRETALRQGATARSVAEASSKKEGRPPTSSAGARR